MPLATLEKTPVYTSQTPLFHSDTVSQDRRSRDEGVGTWWSIISSYVQLYSFSNSERVILDKLYLLGAAASSTHTAASALNPGASWRGVGPLSVAMATGSAVTGFCFCHCWSAPLNPVQ